MKVRLVARAGMGPVPGIKAAPGQGRVTRSRTPEGESSQLSDVMRGFIYDTKSIMFDQHLVLSALSNVGIFISICGQLKKVTNKR